MQRIYLDHTATTPLDPRVFETMKPYFLDKFGNASSVHEYGRQTRAALDESRDTIARLIGAKASEIFFTSGGTESNNYAIKGAAWKMRDRGKSHIITSAVEHHAVLEPCTYLLQNGFSCTFLPVGPDGTIDPDQLRRSIRPETGLISIMHANNEVGSVSPLPVIASIARERDIVFHTDAVQTFGKLPIDTETAGFDFCSLSAHKIYGPKGIGALYIRKGAEAERLLHGGGQERGRRAGTENVPLAVGFASAASLICEEREKENIRLTVLKCLLRAKLEEAFPFIVFNGSGEEALPSILSVSFRSDRLSIDGEALLMNLDMAGVAVAGGSACTSGSITPSHVLLAMGRDVATSRATIRFSPGRSTTPDDIEETVQRLKAIVSTIGRPVS